MSLVIGGRYAESCVEMEEREYPEHENHETSENREKKTSARRSGDRQMPQNKRMGKAMASGRRAWL